MAIFAFDFVGNTHTEALMSLLSKSLTQATSYLVAVHLHDRCPSSIPTSKISHVTENRCWLWVKDNCNHLSFVCPSQRRHFLVNNYSETCIRRTLAGFSLFTQKSSFTTLSSTKALVSFKTNSNKKKKTFMKKRSNSLVWVMVIVIPVLTRLDRWKKWSNSLEVLLVFIVLYSS